MEIGDYLTALRKRWWAVALLAVLGAGLGYVQASGATPLYRSTAKVWVSLAQGSDVTELVQGSTYTRNLVESYVQLTTVPLVLEPVIQDLGLTVTSRQLAAVVSAEAPMDSMIIEISATSRSATRAADIANAVAGQLATAVEQLTPTSAEGQATVQITLVGPATPAAAPFAPNTKLLVATGGAVGLGLGVLVALAWVRLDTRVRTTRDLPDGRVVLGEVPHDRAVTRDGPGSVLDQPRSALAEGYRRVRANLDFLDSTEPVRGFVVTSTLPGEGKSTVSVSLALALADTGRRVLLIDADLRRPNIANVLGIESAVGLTTILARRATLEQVTQQWRLENLHVLPSGPVPPNPTQLIDSTAFADLLAHAQEAYDMVIVDTSPLLAVSDGAVLARRTSGAILVARARKVSRRELAESLDELDALGAACLGVVLNGAQRRRRATSYGYMEPTGRRLAPPRRPRRRGGRPDVPVTSATSRHAHDETPDRAPVGPTRPPVEPAGPSLELDRLSVEPTRPYVGSVRSPAAPDHERAAGPEETRAPVTTADATETTEPTRAPSPEPTPLPTPEPEPEPTHARSSEPTRAPEPSRTSPEGAHSRADA
ncbi:polysaccharide biosynthesis tyrosine autokinase [Cellulomonas palmilytica]|uniref:polysaccharide biosynthesis tyrosine autokinase n=1 Tax=Cellulomonas palmilytica TaxID=2608402 RepID=UPI00294FFA9B|nr:polysaccharide biosynthesis tyrosine autokinase [Cellulomonas palmilytica]UJP41135.1 polysaccharide biosynthesis tyrosine autokinase [Cellulomonas palmilytica]